MTKLIKKGFAKIFGVKNRVRMKHWGHNSWLDPGAYLQVGKDTPKHIAAKACKFSYFWRAIFFINDYYKWRPTWDTILKLRLWCSINWPSRALKVTVEPVFFSFPKFRVRFANICWYAPLSISGSVWSQCIIWFYWEWCMSAVIPFLTSFFSGLIPVSLCIIFKLYYRFCPSPDIRSLKALRDYQWSFWKASSPLIEVAYWHAC